MAKKKTKNQFKKGNKFGRAKLTEAEKELAIKNRTQFKQLLTKYMITGYKELKVFIKRTDVPAIDLMVVRCLLNAIDSGDASQVNWFMDHTLGKQKESTNINLRGTMENTNSVDLKKLTKEQLLQLKAISESSEK